MITLHVLRRLTLAKLVTLNENSYVDAADLRCAWAVHVPYRSLFATVVGCRN